RGRPVRLVAVSKYQPVDAIRAAYDHGQRHFGENYIQELTDKAPQLPDDIAWHFIGAIQRNKVKRLVRVPNLAVVETVDSVKLAQALNDAVEQERGMGADGAEAPAAALRVYVQVNTSDEPNKNGVAPAEAAALATYVHTQCPHLRVVGLMTIGAAQHSHAGGANPDFERLVACRAALAAHPALRDAAPPVAQWALSMGMSADFEAAIQCGATSVRVGSEIFGRRP
ncbi:hypothetical protein CXG81DRAFT_4454, partial [Caulochytrium protostelioides]